MVERESKIDYLTDAIGKTRKSRIEAERRLLKLDALSKHATVYYACITTLLTLLTLFFDYEGLTFLSVASAVVVAICTVYVSAQNYGARAERMRGCYLELQRLCLSLDDKRYMDDEEAWQMANSAGERYVEILQRTENHLTKDYRLATDEACRAYSAGRWLAARFCVYVVPVVAGILFTLTVWPVA